MLLKCRYCSAGRKWGGWRTRVARCWRRKFIIISRKQNDKEKVYYGRRGTECTEVNDRMDSAVSFYFIGNVWSKSSSIHSTPLSQMVHYIQISEYMDEIHTWELIVSLLSQRCDPSTPARQHSQVLGSPIEYNTQPGHDCNKTSHNPLECFRHIPFPPVWTSDITAHIL